MISKLLVGLSAFTLIGVAQASTTTEFEAGININRAALADEASAARELSAIREQAKELCAYERESVLSGTYDALCVADIVAQAVKSVDNANLDRAYSRFAPVTP